MVEISETVMDITDIEQLTSDEQATPFEDGMPKCKIWLVRSKDSTRLYIVSKIAHNISDGLDMLQMFSLM